MPNRLERQIPDDPFPKSESKFLSPPDMGEERDQFKLSDLNEVQFENNPIGGDDLTEPSTQASYVDTLTIYLSEIRKTPLLTKEQEIELAKLIETGKAAETTLNNPDKPLYHESQILLEEQKSAGMEAKKTLIEANTMLVVSVAKKFIGRGLPFLDLIQVGNLGLMRAAEGFDWRRSVKFSTYATWWIRQAITRAIANQARTIRIPVYRNRKICYVYTIINELTQALGRDPNINELAQKLILTPNAVEELLNNNTEPISLEQTLTDNQESQGIAYVIKDKSISPVDEEVNRILLHDLIARLLEIIPPRQALALKLRYGFPDGNPHSYKKIGNMLGISLEGARKLVSNALRSLKDPRILKELQDWLD